MTTISNMQRGCGFLKENSIYLRAEIGTLGELEPFVEFKKPIPYLEHHFRGLRLMNGLQFEMSENAITKPRDEIHKHIKRLKIGTIEKDEITNFAALESPYAFDILMWVGEKYYKKPQDFIREAHAQGVSKKIPLAEPPLIMQGFTKIYFIHPCAIDNKKAGVIGYSYLTHVVYTQSKGEVTPKWITDLSKLEMIDIVDIDKPKMVNQKGLKDVS